MFYGCTGLIVPPELPATELANNCYNRMFAYCTSLSEFPELPALTLPTNCYFEMFYGCSSLSSIKVDFIEWTKNTTSNWVYNVSSPGDFTKTIDLVEEYDISKIPIGWTTINKPINEQFEKENNLTLTANVAGSTVKLTSSGKPTVSGLQYRTSVTNPWQNYEINMVITLENVNDYVQFRNVANTLSKSKTSYVKFVMTGGIKASGNIQSMLKYSEFCNNYCYAYLFKGCTVLISTPILSATTLDDYCYYGMFEGCTTLISGPTLPVLELSTHCYTGMFKNCTSLITAPTLPATTLANYCYYSMFEGCTRLTIAPNLPATNLISYCYNRMFYGCTSLISINAGFIKWVSNSTNNWVDKVAASGTFTKSSNLKIKNGVSYIPNGWTIN